MWAIIRCVSRLSQRGACSEWRGGRNIVTLLNLTVFQNGAWNSGIKTYDYLPPIIKLISNYISKFKAARKRFLSRNSFHTLEEYYSYK